MTPASSPRKHTQGATRPSSYDVALIRKDFPLLTQQVHGKPLVYLDNAATSQKPQEVIDAVTGYYTTVNSNVHRGVHTLSQKATEDFEATRDTAQRFLNAADRREIIFVRGTTEAVNLVAGSYGRKFVERGDEVIISGMEHHSNIVPWQILCEEKDAVLRVIPITDDGELDMEAYGALLSKRAKLVAVTHVSNALGTINPVKRIVQMAHSYNVPVLLDGAQAAPHCVIDVEDIGCDFYAFSGHKVYGPTGIGVLYGKAQWLEAMPPYHGGGEMIKSVTFEKTIYNGIPAKFEAGTPNIADTVGLGAALRYVERLGRGRIAAHEQELLAYATRAISAVEGVRIIGTAREKAAVVSFLLKDIHPHDIGTVLDQEGVAIRTGHHCAQPVMQRFNIPATARASFALYNTKEEVDALVRALDKALEVFS